ncbi:hypothetical protein, partial [Cronobacter sakazakii]|uniref:hypothetical protein n=1 Tax=Cronobacter sakazakii TaxID=28141 RepID=UPI001F29484C
SIKHITISYKRDFAKKVAKIICFKNKHICLNRLILQFYLLTPLQFYLYLYLNSRTLVAKRNRLASLFNFDGALTKREQIPNEMGLGLDEWPG